MRRRQITSVAIPIVWVWGSFAFLVFAAHGLLSLVLGSVSFGLAVACGLMAVAHDALHGNLVASKRLNRLFAVLAAKPVASTARGWIAQHNHLHHPYTNVIGQDEGIDVTSLVRVSDYVPLRWWHRYQQHYIGLLALGQLPALMANDLRYVLTGRVSKARQEQRTTALRLQLLVDKLWLSVLMLAVAFVRQPAWAVVTGAAIAAVVAGVVLHVVFTVQHLVVGAEVLTERVPAGDIDAWTVHQIKAAANMATDRPLLSWYVGYLNFHIEHHLFPGVPMRFLPEVAPLVREFCAANEIHYCDFPSVSAAYGSFRSLLAAKGTASA